MASTSTNMALTLWSSLTDQYDSSQLVANFVKIDAHDHTTGKGIQIPFAGIATAAIATSGTSSSTKLVRADDSRLSNTRTPTDGTVTDATITSGGLSPSKITGTAVITTDSRLSNARPPDYTDFAWTTTGSNPTYSGSFTSTTVSSILRQSGAFTGTATVALPPASQLPAGSEVIIQAGANVSSTNTISIVRAGGDTINGVTTAVVIGAAYGFRRFITDGVSSWVYDAGVVRTSSVFDLTFGSTGLKATSGSSPWNGSAPATIDIDNTKVPTISGSNTVSFITSGTTSLTLPTSGTVLTTTNNQVLTNKSLSDSATYIVDSADNTKRVNIDVTGTTGITGTLQTAFTTAKTIAFPDTAGTVITSGDTNTVTNIILKSSAVDSDRAVTTSHIRDNAITTIKLPNSTSTSNGVTTNKIQYAPAAGASSSYVLSGPTDGTSGTVSFRQIIDSDISDPAVNVNNGINGSKIKILSIPANRLTGVPWGPKSLYVNSSQSIPVTGPTIGDEIYYPAFGTANIISSGGNDTIRVTSISNSSVTFKPTNSSQSLETVFGGLATSYMNKSYTLNCAATGINSANAQPFASNASSITIDLIDSSGVYYPPQEGNFVSGVGIVNGTFITDVQPVEGTANRYTITLSANTNSTTSQVTVIAITGTGFDKISFTIPGTIGLQAVLATGTNVVTLTAGDTSQLSVGQNLVKDPQIGGVGVFASNPTVNSILDKTKFTVSGNHVTAGSITFDAGRLTTTNGSVTVPLNNASGITTQSGLNQVVVITEVPKQLWHLRFSGPGWHYVGGTPLVKRITGNYDPVTSKFIGAYARRSGGWSAMAYNTTSVVTSNTVPNSQLDVAVPIIGSYKVDVSGTARFNIDATNQNGPTNATTLEYSFGMALATLRQSLTLTANPAGSSIVSAEVFTSGGAPLSYATWAANPSNYSGAYTEITIGNIANVLPYGGVATKDTCWSQHTRLYFEGTNGNGYPWFVTSGNPSYDGVITSINTTTGIVRINQPLFIGSYNSLGTVFTQQTTAFTLTGNQKIDAYSWKKISETDLFATCPKYSNDTGSGYATASGTYVVNLNQTRNAARILKPIYSVSQGPSNAYDPLTVASETITLTPITTGYVMSDTELLG
jgi:hypothetical protein